MRDLANTESLDHDVDHCRFLPNCNHFPGFPSDGRRRDHRQFAVRLPLDDIVPDHLLRITCSLKCQRIWRSAALCENRRVSQRRIEYLKHPLKTIIVSVFRETQ